MATKDSFVFKRLIAVEVASVFLDKNKFLKFFCSFFLSLTVFITPAKEVLFLVRFDYLFVCQQDCGNTYLSDFHEMWWNVVASAKEESFTFWT